jgi:hypothetical protein
MKFPVALPLGTVFGEGSIDRVSFDSSHNGNRGMSFAHDLVSVFGRLLSRPREIASVLDELNRIGQI